MLIDCDSCAVRGRACRDCVVNVLIGVPTRRRDRATGPEPEVDPRIELDRDEQAALAVLAGSGLVPPLRLVARPVDPDVAGAANWHHEPAAPARNVRGGPGDAGSDASRRVAG